MTMDTEIAMNNMHHSSLSKHTGIGARLKTAREALHLSEKEAASRLHLSPKLITVMENEEFENGLPPTFMRGYIRSYGRLLSIPAQDIDAAIEQLGMNVVPTTSLAPTSLHTSLDNNNEQYVQWLTYIIIALLVGLVVIWWVTHPQDPRSSLKDKPKEINAPVATTPAPTAPVSTPAPTATAPITAQPPISSSSTKSAPQIASPTPVTAEPDNVKSSAETARSTATGETTQTNTSASSTTKEETSIQMAHPEPGLDTSDY